MSFISGKSWIKYTKNAHFFFYLNSMSFMSIKDVYNSRLYVIGFFIIFIYQSSLATNAIDGLHMIFIPQI